MNCAKVLSEIEKEFCLALETEVEQCSQEYIDWIKKANVDDSKFEDEFTGKAEEFRTNVLSKKRKRAEFEKAIGNLRKLTDNIVVYPSITTTTTTTADTDNTTIEQNQHQLEEKPALFSWCSQCQTHVEKTVLLDELTLCVSCASKMQNQCNQSEFFDDTDTNTESISDFDSDSDYDSEQDSDSDYDSENDSEQDSDDDIILEDLIVKKRQKTDDVCKVMTSHFRVDIMELGKISLKPGFHTDKYIFPVGFVSKTYFQGNFYMNYILDKGFKKPVYEISLMDSDGEFVETWSTERAMKLGPKGIRHICGPKPKGRESFEARQYKLKRWHHDLFTSGDDIIQFIVQRPSNFESKTRRCVVSWFGLENRSVKIAIQNLPNANQCTKYHPVSINQ